LQKVGSKLTEEQLVKLIRDGKGGMPAYGKRLGEEEIAPLAKWLAEQK
jgi:mono/diheme cytochrome c family protein